MDISGVAVEDRPLLLLIGELIFESPVVEPDGTVLEYENVVQQLHRDLIAYTFEAGARKSKYMRVVSLNLKVGYARRPQSDSYKEHFLLKASIEDYALAVRWLHRLLFCVDFVAERLQVNLQRLINSCAEAKRDGDEICRLLLAHSTRTHGQS